jgi:hypothetical protein
MDEPKPLNLGEFIEALSVIPPERRGDVYLAFRFGSANPGELTSYRGYYDRLALTFDCSASRKVQEILDTSVGRSTRKSTQGKELRQ